MSEPMPTHRSVAGLLVPLPLVPDIVAAIRDGYPAATAGIADHDAAVRAALKAWVTDLYAGFMAKKAKDPLSMAVAQTVAAFEADAEAARTEALEAAAAIVEDPAALT